MLLIFSNTKKASSATNPERGYIAIWNGSTWIRRPIKIWNGTSWVVKPLRFWDGTTWRYTYNTSVGVVLSIYEDLPNDPGTYKGNALIENANDSGTYTSQDASTISEDPNDPGTYSILTY